MSPDIQPFHERFSISFHSEEARKRLVTRILNEIEGEFPDLEEISYSPPPPERQKVLNHIAVRLGKRFIWNVGFEGYIQDNYYDCLLAIEALYEVYPKQKIDEIVKRCISLAETDLGINWRDGHFWPSGAKLLDEALVNDNLKWLRSSQYANVLTPFEKGLRDYMDGQVSADKLKDAVTDIYEALEATAKAVLGNDRDLSANREAFIRRLDLNSHFRDMLKEYIEYANEYRHAVREERPRENPKPEEVETFIYTTGLFIRLAIRKLG